MRVRQAVTQKHKLLQLPRPQGVGSILDEFLKSRKKRDRVTVEVVESVRMYFKRALGTILLYRFERRQYQELLQSTGIGGDGSAAGAGSSTRDNVDVCKVYGAEHLLRLLGALAHAQSVRPRDTRVSPRSPPVPQSSCQACWRAPFSRRTKCARCKPVWARS